jgi:hypothetical protein
MIRRQLGAEIDSFLQVGLARSELCSDREIAAPRTTAARHGDFHFRFEILGKEPAARVLDPVLQLFIYSMPDDVEEAGIAAGSCYLGRHPGAVP